MFLFSDSFRQDYKPQNVYIVLNGRVRSVLLTQDKKRRELIGEHGRGEMVGLIEVLMEMPRQSTTIAVRYVRSCELIHCE